MAIATIEDLKKIKQTKTIQLPAFFDGTVIQVEVQQPSLVQMMFEGRVSNPLLNDVQALTEGGASPDAQMLGDTERQKSAFSFIKSVVKYCLVSPTMEEIEQYAGGLTDEQVLYIYNSVVQPVQDISKFRSIPANS